MGAMEGLSVLLLEDEFLISLEAEDMLARMGAVRVKTAHDLDEAERLIGNYDFDVAMLDVNVNGKTSLGLAATLKERGVPVLFATGYELKSKGMGVDESVAYITKPYSFERLESALAAVVVRKAQSAPSERAGTSGEGKPT